MAPGGSSDLCMTKVSWPVKNSADGQKQLKDGSGNGGSGSRGHGSPYGTQPNC